MVPHTKVVVIGGSVGGVSTAVALVKAGCQVTVLERAAAIVATTGAVWLHCCKILQKTSTIQQLTICRALGWTLRLARLWCG